MGRAPCCDKANVKKGPWSPEEDAKLKSYIEQNGTGGNWIALPQKIGLKRCGKSCRLRWLNYLRPNIKHGGFSEEEDRIICSLYISIGSRWSIIAAQLPGRTDNDIKNYWNTRLKKKLLGKQRKDHHHPPGRRSKRSSSSSVLLLEHHHQPNNHNNSINPPAMSNYNHPFYTPNYNPNNDDNQLNDINISYWPSAPAQLHPATSSSLPASSATELVNNNPYCSASFGDDQLGLPGQTGFTDQNPSIMKSLLVKMEGGGGDHSAYADFDGGLIINSNIHPLPLFLSVPQQINEDPPADHVGMMDMISSSLNMINMSNEYKYHNLEKLGQSMAHGETNATTPAIATTVTTTTTTTSANNNPYSVVELDQLMSSINPPQSSNPSHNYETSLSAAGLDIMAWNEMMINRNGSGGCGADSIESWGEMSSLISLPIPAPVHLCGELDELRYTTGVQ